MIMNAKRRIWLSMTIAILSATASLAQQVKTDHDRNADFSRYKTYSWGNVHTQDPLWVDRIKGAVYSALAAKEWALVEEGGDISIMGMEMTNERRTLRTYYDDFGGGWRWGWSGGFGTATTTEETYTVGTLVIDMFDTHTKMLVWRGSASDTVSDKSDRNIRKLDMSVRKMFERFPPKPSAKPTRSSNAVIRPSLNLTKLKVRALEELRRFRGAQRRIPQH